MMAQAGATLISLGRKPGYKKKKKRNESARGSELFVCFTTLRIPTCKQGGDAVLCQNPTHHTYGGAGKLAGYWEQKANAQHSLMVSSQRQYSTPEPHTDHQNF